MDRRDEPDRATSHERPPGEGSDADIAEQARSWVDEEEERRPEVPPDAPEADVLEQSKPVDVDEDDRGH